MCELIKNKDTILREVSSQMDDQLPIVFWTSSAEIKILKKKATGKKKKKKKSMIMMITKMFEGVNP